MRLINALAILAAAGIPRSGHALVDLSEPYTIPIEGDTPNAVTPDGQKLVAIAESEDDIHSFLALECGRVVASYGDLAKVRHLFSATKSWTGLVMGVAETEGLIDLSETLGEIFTDPELWIDVDDAEDRKKTTLEQLVQMRGGYDMPGDFLQDVLIDALPFTDNRLGGEDLKGSLTYHPLNTTNIGTYKYVMAANILSYVIHAKTGMTPEEFASEKIFPALGITEDDYEWYVNPDGMQTSFHGLKMTVPAFSKLGMLYLQDGMASDTKQLVDPSWIERSFTIGDPNAKPGDKFGYIGWWIEEPGDGRRVATYGFGGQRLAIDLDTHRLLAIQSETYGKDAGLTEYETPNKKYPTDMIKEWALNKDWTSEVEVPQTIGTEIAKESRSEETGEEVCLTKKDADETETPDVVPTEQTETPDVVPTEPTVTEGSTVSESSLRRHAAAFLFSVVAAVLV